MSITIGNETYSCSPTMGAMLRFKQETGREVTEIDQTSITDIVTYLYCCVCSGAKKEGKKLELSLMDFADSISAEALTQWTSAVTDEAEEQKKSKTQKRK